MKKLFLIISVLFVVAVAQAQHPLVTIGSHFEAVDTARAARIIDNYISMLNFSTKKDDSVLYVVSKIVDLDHPNDTMFIYRWYQNPRKIRIEIWSGGKIIDGYIGDGISVHRKFHTNYREWMDLTPESFFETTLPFDIRGALYQWREKGAEISYAGEFTFEGHPVDRVYVTCPSTFDRYYYFEKHSGLLFFVTEEEHMFGDGKPNLNAHRLDWRAWSEFIPVSGNLLPSIESYQENDATVVMYHSYKYIPPQTDIFSENYIKR